jgi:hypothetical protein
MKPRGCSRRVSTVRSASARPGRPARDMPAFPPPARIAAPRIGSHPRGIDLYLRKTAGHRVDRNTRDQNH